MNAGLLIFSLLATCAVIAGISVVASKSAVRSALSLVVTFVILAILYFTLNSELLGITQIVVYAGAIMVLFLFVIMLLNLGTKGMVEEKFDGRKAVVGLLGIGLAAVIGGQAFYPLMGTGGPSGPSDFGTPQAIGRTLFSTYAFPFEAVSVLLMIGIVGSILLAKRRLE